MLDLGGIPLRADDARRGRPAGHRGRPDGDAPGAARAVPRRGRHRRRRGADDGGRARRGRALKKQRRTARRAPARPREARGRLRPVALRDARRRRTPASPSSIAPLAPEARAARRPHARRRPEPLPLPRRQPHRRPRGHLRPHVDRDRPRLHRGLPLLPGRHDLPPGARARPAADRRDGRQRREEERLRRGEPHVAVDGGLLVHRAAREEGGRRARAEEGVASASRRLRAYGLDENVLDDMARVRATGVTFAPEAGTQRMRDVINKNVTEEQLLQTAERIFSRGWSAMKLYFMIGLPTEEEEDVRAIPQVGGRARAIGKQVKRALGAPGAPKVTVSVSTHVPKPHTPFQWCAMDTAGRRAREAALAQGRGARGERRPSDARLRDVVARGASSRAAIGRSRPCSSAPTERGARFDSWEDQKKIDVWEDGVPGRGRRPGEVPRHHPGDARACPWDHIDVGLEEGFLLARVPQGAQEPALAPLRQGRGRVRARDQPDGRRRRRRASSSATTAASRATSARCASSASSTCASSAPTSRAPPAPPPRSRPKGPPPRIEQGEARRYRFVYEKLGRRARSSRTSTSSARCRARSAGSSSRSSTRRGFHPKPDMTFGPALSPRRREPGEVVDVKIAADLEPRARCSTR